MEAARVALEKYHPRYLLSPFSRDCDWRNHMIEILAPLCFFVLVFCALTVVGVMAYGNVAK
jgi:hypothetical protein